MNWEKIILPKELVGICIRDLVIHYKCMMMLWLWRCNINDSALWMRVIKARYDEQNHWCTKLPHRYGVSLWKGIPKCGWNSVPIEFLRWEMEHISLLEGQIVRRFFSHGWILWFISASKIPIGLKHALCGWKCMEYNIKRNIQIEIK